MEREEKIELAKLALEKLKCNKTHYICHAMGMALEIKGISLFGMELANYMEIHFNDLSECAKQFCMDVSPTYVNNFQFNGQSWFDMGNVSSRYEAHYKMKQFMKLRIAILKDYIQKLENGEI